MSSAVQNLQKAIVGGQKSLTQLLRETKLIAAKLNLADVEKWVDCELKGYPSEVEPPKYRTYFTTCVQIRNPIRGWEFGGNLEIDTQAYEPISQIEDYSKQETLTTALERNLPVKNPIATDWPQRLVVNGAQFKKIVDSVTNELLEWTVELEKRGIKGEDMNFDEKEKQTAVHQTFNIQKFTAGVVGTANNSQVTVYDYSSINQLLIDHQIPKQDRRELEDIMDELKTAPADTKPSLLKRAEKWLLEHKELLGAAADAIGKAIGAAVKQ